MIIPESLMHLKIESSKKTMLLVNRSTWQAPAAGFLFPGARKWICSWITEEVGAVTRKRYFQGRNQTGIGILEIQMAKVV